MGFYHGVGYVAVWLCPAAVGSLEGGEEEAREFPPGLGVDGRVSDWRRGMGWRDRWLRDWNTYQI